MKPEFITVMSDSWEYIETRVKTIKEMGFYCFPVPVDISKAGISWNILFFGGITDPIKQAINAVFPE